MKEDLVISNIFVYKILENPEISMPPQRGSWKSYQSPGLHTGVRKNMSHSISVWKTLLPYLFLNLIIKHTVKLVKMNKKNPSMN